MRLRIVLNGERCVIGVPAHVYLVEDLARYIKEYFDLSSSACLLVDDFLVPYAEIVADVLRDNDVVEVRVNPAKKRQRSTGGDSDAEHIDAKDSAAEKAVPVASSSVDDDSRSEKQSKKAKVALVTKTSPARAQKHDTQPLWNNEQLAVRTAPSKPQPTKTQATAGASSLDDSSRSDSTPKAKKSVVKAKVKASTVGPKKTAAAVESSSDESSSDDAPAAKKPVVKAKVKAPPAGIRKAVAAADSSSDESVVKKPAVKAQVKAPPAGLRKTGAAADSSDDSSSDDTPVAKKHIVPPAAKATASFTASRTANSKATQKRVARHAKAPAEPSGAHNVGRASHNFAASEEHGTKLFVGAVAQAVTEAELRAHFSQFGQVSECTIVIDKNRQRSRGYAFVIMGSPKDAQAILAQSHTLHNRTLDIKIARPRAEKGRKGPPTTSSTLGTPEALSAQKARKQSHTTSSTPVVPAASSAQAHRDARQQLQATDDLSRANAGSGPPSAISMPSEPVGLEVAQAVALELARAKKLELARKAGEARKAENGRNAEGAHQADGKREETEEEKHARARRYEEEYQRQRAREAEEMERVVQQQEAWARVLSCPADAPEETPTEISTEEEMVNPDAEIMRSMGLPVAFAGDAQCIYDEE